MKQAVALLLFIGVIATIPYRGIEMDLNVGYDCFVRDTSVNTDKAIEQGIYLVKEYKKQKIKYVPKVGEWLRLKGVDVDSIENEIPGY